MDNVITFPEHKLADAQPNFHLFYFEEIRVVEYETEAGTTTFVIEGVVCADFDGGSPVVYLGECEDEEIAQNVCATLCETCLVSPE